jgi:hypothetical protein
MRFGMGRGLSNLKEDGNSDGKEKKKKGNAPPGATTRLGIGFSGGMKI